MATTGEGAGTDSVARSRGVALLLGGAADSVERVRERLSQSPEAWGIQTQVVSPDTIDPSSVPPDTRLVVADYSAVSHKSREVVLDWLKQAAKRFKEGTTTKPGATGSPNSPSILVQADDPADQEQIREALSQWRGLYLVASAADLLPKVSKWLAEQIPRVPFQPNWLRDRSISRDDIEGILRNLLDLGVSGTGGAVRWQPVISHACLRLDTWKGWPGSGELLRTHIQAVKDEILWKSRLSVAEEADLRWLTEYALATVLAVFANRHRAAEGTNFLARAQELIDPRSGDPVPVKARPGTLLALLIVLFARMLAGRTDTPRERLVGLRAEAGRVVLDVYAAESDLFGAADETELKLRVYQKELASEVERSDTGTTVNLIETKGAPPPSQPPPATVSFQFSAVSPPPA